MTPHILPSSLHQNNTRIYTRFCKRCFYGGLESLCTYNVFYASGVQVEIRHNILRAVKEGDREYDINDYADKIGTIFKNPSSKERV